MWVVNEKNNISTQTPVVKEFFFAQIHAAHEWNGEAESVIVLKTYNVTFVLSSGVFVCGWDKKKRAKIKFHSFWSLLVDSGKRLRDVNLKWEEMEAEVGIW